MAKDTKAAPRPAAARKAKAKKVATPYPHADVLAHWGVTLAEASSLLLANPSLRGNFMGYVAERRLQTKFLDDDRITELRRPGEHDRADGGDYNFKYKGQVFSLESKSLQTAKVKSLGDGKWQGQYQCDGSDSRMVTFRDGSKLKTVCLLYGGFDVVAVNCFEFGGVWQFAFCRNSELQCSTGRNYSERQQEQLIATMQSITWPVEKPYTTDLFALLDEIVRERRK